MDDQGKSREEILSELKELRQENESLKASFAEKIAERDHANKKFRMLFKLSPIGMALVDHKTGDFIEVNDSVLNAIGYTKEEFINLSYWDITPREYEAQELQQIEDLNKTGFFGPNTKEYIRKDGSRYPISISGALYTNTYGEKVVWGIIEDITERKQAETIIKKQNEELKNFNAAKDRFITILAHDIRGPFGSIVGLLDLMTRDFNNCNMEKIEKYLNMMNSVAKNTFSLLDDILMWVKANSNKMDFEPDIIAVNSIYNEIIQLFVPIANSKNIKIINSLNGNPKIYADKNMLKTILRNLVSNSIKFTDEQGQIEIYTEIKEDKVITTISDNGVGMETDIKNKLFNIQNKITTKGTANENGTGLGLLICKEFVEKHNGDIWVESEMGKGSEFKFSIPLNA